MYFVWYAVVGLLAGALAKALMSGDKKEPQGCLMTMLLGVAGSMLTGFILHDLLGWRTSGSFIGSIIGAALGAMLIIWLLRKFSK